MNVTHISGVCTVLPLGDLGVRKGMMKLYGLPKLPTPVQMETIAHTWQPYRTVGSFYMYRVADTVGC